MTDKKKRNSIAIIAACMRPALPMPTEAYIQLLEALLVLQGYDPEALHRLREGRLV